MHWGAVLKHKNDVKNETIIQALAYRKHFPKRLPLTVTASLYKYGKQLDLGNCYPTLKAVVDGVVKAGLIKDDSREYVDRIVFAGDVEVGRGEGKFLVKFSSTVEE